MKIFKKIIVFIIFFIVVVFINAMFRGHRVAEQRKVSQQGAVEAVDSGFIKTQLTKQEDQCTSMALNFKQFASFRDAGMKEKDVYVFLTNGKSVSTKKHIESILRWIYKDRSISTPEGIAAEVAAACVQGKMPSGLDN